MELFSTVWHVITAFLVFMAGGFLLLMIRKSFSLSAGRLLLIYIWHTGLCVFYAFYVINNGGDALMYYNASLGSELEFSLGTKAVVYINSFFSNVLGFSFIGCFLVFNVFGTIGLIAFYAALREAVIGKSVLLQRAVTLIVFLPSVSFWSSAIGKDAISFMATGLALWAALDMNRRRGLMVFSVLAMLLVRPHMAGIMVMAIALSSLLDPKASLLNKLALGAIAAGAAGALVPFALNYAGVGETADVEAFSVYIEQRQSYNTEGGGGVDIASMSLPMQLFTYLMRPVIIEARTVFELAASLDNLILLGLFVFGGFALMRGRKSTCGGNRAFMWAYALGAWLILSMTTANLGIALRQKWMFLPMLIFLLISVIGKQRQVNIKVE